MRQNEACYGERAYANALFQELYEIENLGKKYTAEEHCILQNSEARPIWEPMRERLASDAIANVMPKESFGQALTYLRNQFEHLLAYLDDGLIPIDNNESEQLMKHVALGLTNRIFIRSVDAGYLAADLMTPVSSAARNDLDIFLYGKHLLDRLLAGDTEYEALWPNA